MLKISRRQSTRSLLKSGDKTAPGAGHVVRTLLKRNPASVNVIHGVKRCTALHMAARRVNVDVIAALLDGGADIEARDSAGETPLRRAVNCNKVWAAKLLLERAEPGGSARVIDPPSVGLSKALVGLVENCTSVRSVTVAVRRTLANCDGHGGY